MHQGASLTDSNDLRKRRVLVSKSTKVFSHHLTVYTLRRANVFAIYRSGLPAQEWRGE